MHINWVDVGVMVTCVCSLAGFITPLIFKVIRAAHLEAQLEALEKLNKFQNELLQSHALALSGIPVMEARLASLESERNRFTMTERSLTIQIESFEQVIQLLMDSSVPKELKERLNALMARIVAERERHRRELIAFDESQAFYNSLRAKNMPLDERVGSL